MSYPAAMCPTELPYETRVINMDFIVEDLERVERLRPVIAELELRRVPRTEIVRRALRLGLVLMEEQYGMEPPAEKPPTKKKKRAR